MFNTEAEQGLLGILLTNNRRYDDISDFVRPEHFFHPEHQQLFHLIKDDIESGRKSTIVGLSERFPYERLLTLLDSFILEDNARHYGEIVVDLYKRRQIESLSKCAQELAKEKNGTELVSFLEKGLLSIAEPESGQEVSVYDAAGEALKWMEDIRVGKIKPIKTGFKWIDEKIGGLYSGRLYVLAGRPAMGKTALALNIADNVSAEFPILFLSLEMAKSELAMRLIASRTGIGVDRQQSPHDLNSNDWTRLEQARTSLKDKPLIIHDAGKVDILQIKTWCRRFKRTKGRFVLIIDYLGLMQMDRGLQSRVHQIEDITVSLKALAKELEIPILLLSQLSRSVESREDKRPLLSDLRDSGAIEQDADVVMLCYRDEYYASKEEPQRSGLSEEKYQKKIEEFEKRKEQSAGKAEVIIAKNRQGKDGIAYLKFDGEKQKFSD